MNTTTNMVMVNGKKYEVVGMGEMTAVLVGPRGGAVSLVRNINSGRWFMITGGTRPRSILVESLEVMA